jgi:hypothetical protein
MNDFPFVLVTINVVPDLEDPIIDWLLEQEGDTGFTSLQAHGHGSLHDLVTRAEQVSGRQRRLQFQVMLDTTRATGFLEDMKRAFSGADIRYWCQPVSATGSFAQ